MRKSTFNYVVILRQMAAEKYMLSKFKLLDIIFAKSTFKAEVILRQMFAEKCMLSTSKSLHTYLRKKDI